MVDICTENNQSNFSDNLGPNLQNILRLALMFIVRSTYDSDLRSYDVLRFFLGKYVIYCKTKTITKTVRAYSFFSFCRITDFLKTASC